MHGVMRKSRIVGTTRTLDVRTMKRSVKMFLPWRLKDEEDSRDDSDAGRQDNEEVS